MSTLTVTVPVKPKTITPATAVKVARDFTKIIDSGALKRLLDDVQDKNGILGHFKGARDAVDKLDACKREVFVSVQEHDALKAENASLHDEIARLASSLATTKAVANAKLSALMEDMDSVSRSLAEMTGELSDTKIYVELLEMLVADQLSQMQRHKAKSAFLEAEVRRLDYIARLCKACKEAAEKVWNCIKSVAAAIGKGAVRVVKATWSVTNAVAHGIKTGAVAAFEAMKKAAVVVGKVAVGTAVVVGTVAVGAAVAVGKGVSTVAAGVVAVPVAAVAIVGVTVVATGAVVVDEVQKTKTKTKARLASIFNKKQ